MLHNIHIRNRILPDGNSHNQKCISVVLEIHKGCIKSCKAFFLPVFILPSYLLPILNSFCWTKNITASSHQNASQNRKIIEPNVYLWVVGWAFCEVLFLCVKWVRTGCSLWNSVNYRAFNPITLDSPSLNVFASHSLREVLRQFDPNVNELHAVTRLSCSDFELSILITTSVL